MNNKCFLFNQRDIDSYQPISKIDEGSYGIVYKAIDKETNEVVAIQKIKLQQGNESLYDFPITSIREINIVFSLCHPNILKFKQIAYGNKYNKIYTVMEYLDFELKNLLIVQKHSFSSFNIKSISNSGFVQYLYISLLDTIPFKSLGIGTLSFCLSPPLYTFTGKP